MKKLGIAVFLIMLIYGSNRYLSVVQEKKLALSSKRMLTQHEEEKSTLYHTSNILFSGFKVFILDFLWLRIIALENTGDYYEILMTANLIADLQPHYTDTWEYLGHTMIYNVSGKEKNRDVKLEWIKAGLSYMQKGIKRNPWSGKLHISLGRMMNEKLGVYHERNLDHYFAIRNEGGDPVKNAHQMIKQGVELGDYDVHAERQLFIINLFLVREAVFYCRENFRKKLNMLIALLESKIDPNDAKESFYKEQENAYLKFSKEFPFEEWMDNFINRVKQASFDLDQNIIKYPAQYDFELSRENHQKEFLGWRENIEIFYIEFQKLKELENSIRSGRIENKMIPYEKINLEILSVLLERKEKWMGDENGIYENVLKETQQKLNELNLKKAEWENKIGIKKE